MRSSQHNEQSMSHQGSLTPPFHSSTQLWPLRTYPTRGIYLDNFNRVCRCGVWGFIPGSRENLFTSICLGNQAHGRSRQEQRNHLPGESVSRICKFRSFCSWAYGLVPKNSCWLNHRTMNFQLNLYFFSPPWA